MLSMCCSSAAVGNISQNYLISPKQNGRITPRGMQKTYHAPSESSSIRFSEPHLLDRLMATVIFLAVGWFHISLTLRFRDVTRLAFVMY